MAARIDYHGISFPWPAPFPVAPTFERVEASLLTRFLTPEDRVIVAGAGMGLLLAVAAACTAPDRVYGYEPNAPLARLVQQNVRVDGQALMCEDWGLSVDGAPLDLVIPHHNWALAGTGLSGPGRVLRAPTIPIHEALRHWQATALALDVEGAERALLPALLQLTQPLPALLMVELHGNDALGLLAPCLQAGYLLRELARREDEDVYFAALTRAEES